MRAISTTLARAVHFVAWFSPARCLTSMADFVPQVCHFSRPGADLNAAASTALGPGHRQNGRVANGLCHSPECNKIGHFVTLAARTTAALERRYDKSGEQGKDGADTLPRIQPNGDTPMDVFVDFGLGCGRTIRSRRIGRNQGRTKEWFLRVLRGGPICLFCRLRSQGTRHG